MSSDRINSMDWINQIHASTQIIANTMSRINRVLNPIIQQQTECYLKNCEALKPTILLANQVSKSIEPSIFALREIISEVNNKLINTPLLLYNFPSTDNLLGTFNDELSYEELYTLSKDIITEVEKNEQWYSGTDEYMSSVQKKEGEMLLDVVRDNIDQGVSRSKTEEVIKNFSEAARLFALDLMIRVIFGILIYFVSVKIEPDPTTALLEPIISVIKLLVSKD